MGLALLKKKLDLLPSKEEMDKIDLEVKLFNRYLLEAIKKTDIDAEVALGGSYQKKTLIKSELYDVDFFVRFDWKYENLAELLQKVINFLPEEIKRKAKKVHGSRDYFKIEISENLVFEVIPVTRIKKSGEARNVTDLSFFHTSYVKRKINENIRSEIAFAKLFLKASGIYGAESYISGFSGYGIECLIIYYKSLEKMLREFVSAKERIIIDIEKQYKRKEDVLFEMNESRIKGPVILVDPVSRERNVLAALNRESFEKLMERGRALLKNPSIKYFESYSFNEDKWKERAKKIKGEIICVKMETERQEGDIAGTKMKKFSRYLEREISREFEIKESFFDYDLSRTANYYMLTKRKKEVIKVGPPQNMIESVKEFKKKNKGVFLLNKKYYSKTKPSLTIKEFIEMFKSKNANKLNEMSISNLEII